jgi:hypothetical protein
MPATQKNTLAYVCFTGFSLHNMFIWHKLIVITTKKSDSTYELRLTKESTTSDQKIEKMKDIKYERET